jgi:hypothetical protein
MACDSSFEKRDKAITGEVEGETIGGGYDKEQGARIEMIQVVSLLPVRLYRVVRFVREELNKELRNKEIWIWLAYIRRRGGHQQRRGDDDDDSRI